MALPLQKTDILPLSLLQSSWKSALDPVLANPTTNMSILKNVNLIVGTNVINHLLGQTMQGWQIVDIQGQVTYPPYRNAPFNNLTLSIYSPSAVTVSIGVF